MGSYRFGTIEVRPAERRVLVEGAPAALGARAFDLLVTLIENRNRVMSKDELLALVWPGVVVEENNLQVQVSTLRKILGSEAVSTLPGRGYRFTLVPDGDGAAMSGAAAPAAPAHNLPAELNTFVGREVETAEVAKLLGSSRLVTLTGVGGTGKTRLSLHVAEAALAQFPDGAWLVELAPVAEERHVQLAVASALGFPEAELAASVANRRLLVVLDNCEHLLRGCAGIARVLLQAGPGIRILASSREPLHLAGEATYRVPPLSRAQAIQLFVERARDADPALDPAMETSQAVMDICKSLDDLPLAIELAAARVRAFSVTKIAERLDHRFRLLTGGDRTAAHRQRTLRASIDWSYDLLALPERALLRRLAVFTGGWTLEAAEAVGGSGEVEMAASVLELITGLVEKSLVAVEPHGKRYHLLETVREYALEHLEESGEGAAIRDRHVQWMLAFASRARQELIGPDYAAWLHAIDLERENVLAALTWCRETPANAELGMRLVATLKQYWFSRGLVALARSVMLEALERSPERSRARCRTLFDVGQMEYFIGLHRDARAHLEESLSIARETNDRVAMGQALQPLGMACLGLGEVAAAEVHLEEALSCARELGDPRSVAAAINALAQFKRVQGDLVGAEPLFEHLLDLAREMHDRESVAIALLNLAMTSVDLERPERARPRLAEAAAIAEETGSKQVGQSVLEAGAGLASLRGEWTLCARLYGAAEAEAARTSLRRDPADEAFLSHRVEAARRALDPEGFIRAEQEGRALAYEVAIGAARAWLAAAPEPVPTS
jgi:non-specific serine/threonine protein kinase